MKQVAEIISSDLKIVFVTNYYDRPLSGLCYYNGDLTKFELNYDPEDDEGINETYFIFSLTVFEKIKYLFQKKMFEICVGYHQTYVNNKKPSFFYMRKPKWVFSLLYNFYYYKFNFKKYRSFKKWH